jgi:O-methyltransferase domain/Dimerisation domain
VSASTASSPSGDLTGAAARRDAGMLLQLLAGRWISQAVCVAANLGVADRLADESKHVDELAREVGASPDALQRLLRALASAGVFREVAPRRWGLSPSAALLRGDVPSSLRGLARFLGTSRHYEAWGALEHSVRTGTQAYRHVHGEEFWEAFADSPQFAEAFNESMTSVAQQFYAAIVSAYDFSAFDTLVDVGGGEGELVLRLLERWPRLRATVFDLPDAAAAAGRRIAARGMQDRARAAGGSFFDAIPGGADAYVLTHVIHNWNDELATKILVNVRGAMRDDSVVLLGEQVIAAGNAPDFAKLLDLEMLVLTDGGRERTAGDFERLLSAAGLELRGVVNTASGAKIVEAVLSR